MIYLTKDKSGLVQLWNNKPELANDIWLAWIDKSEGKNEVAIDVTSNDYLRSLFNDDEIPACYKLNVVKL